MIARGLDDDDQEAAPRTTPLPPALDAAKRTGVRKLRYYKHGIPYLKDVRVSGSLIVVEGPDAAGRSTHTRMIQTKLEAEGHAVLGTGLKRSELISEGIMEAKANLGIGKRTLGLFYAADFADQLENKIIPALEAGYIVLADRYIFTLMARNSVRGINKAWSRNLFGFAVIPDLIFYLNVRPQELVHRVFQKSSKLDYYESGMDMGISGDMYKSFVLYQTKLAREFDRMREPFGLQFIDGNRSLDQVDAELQGRIESFLSAPTTQSKNLLSGP